MIIDFDKKVAILGNRKCGSSSLYNRFLQVSDVQAPFKGKPGKFDSICYKGDEIELSEEERSFFSQHFKHFNVNQALLFLDKIGVEGDGFTFFICIRNPYERCVSEFKYYLSTASTEVEFNRRLHMGVNDFILNMKRLHENAFDFFSFNAFENIRVNVEVLKVESLDHDLNYLINKYSLERFRELMNSSLKRVNATNHIENDSGMVLGELTKAYIRTVFKSDFEVGEYNVP